MSRYFMHLRDHTEEVLDPEGVELGWDQIDATVLRCARDCMSHDVLAGVLDLRYRIDLEDGRGRLVRSLGFADAVKIVSS